MCHLTFVNRRPQLNHSPVKVTASPVQCSCQVVFDFTPNFTTTTATNGFLFLSDDSVHP